MFKNIKKIPQFLKEAKEELKKVSWSSRHELISATIIVLITAGMLTTYIALVDLGFSKAVQILLR